MLTPDLEQAAAFLSLLDPEAQAFTFQTFDDQKERKRGDLVRIFNGTLEQHAPELTRLSAEGAGVFVTVNATDGRGRRLANIVRLRAIFQEADMTGAKVPPLEPHIVVESSPGKFHRYWLIDSATEPPVIEWLAVMRRMVADWDSDPNAKDAARVLRLLGFPHQKNPESPHMVRVVALSSRTHYRWDEIVAVIPPLQMAVKNYHAIKGNGIKCPLEIKSALASLDPDSKYDDWIAVGMALHHADNGGGEGFALWDDWSAHESGLYQLGECEYKWDGFGDYSGPAVTLGTVFHMAKEAGWNWPNERALLAEAAKLICDATIAISASDPKAYLKFAPIEAFKILRAEDPSAYEGARQDLKKSNKDIRIGALDSLVGKPPADDDRASLSSKLADLASERCELWHDPDGNCFASFDRDEPIHREHWAISSEAFREWLAWLAHTELEAAPSGDALKSVQNALAGKAKFDGDQHTTALRIAKDESGYWIDLCDDAWRAVLVTATGWRIVDRPTVRFRRTKAMRPLPVPLLNGSLDPLWPLVNIPEEDRSFVLAWMLEALRAGTPFPVLELIGEQGSAKSTTQTVIRTFIDPNKAMLRSAPKSREDIFVAAGNNHIVSLENLSGLSPEYSDALCTIATGGGMAGRQYYTNDEENIIEAHNPVILNSISAVITRPDLLDRAIVICPPVIEQRLTEAEHGVLLEQHAPSIMGGLLDLFSSTLAELPNVHIPKDKLPRMADFASLGESMNWVLGGEEDAFLDAYISHRREATRRTIDASPVAAACIRYIEAGKEFAGTVGQLLNELSGFACDHERGDYWPRSGKGLGDQFRRVCPALRQLGIVATIGSKQMRDGVHCALQRGSFEIVNTPLLANPHNRFLSSPMFTQKSAA
jgi:hypothetical protein